MGNRKEGIKQKDFIIRIIEKAVEEVEAKWQGLEQPEETPEADRMEESTEETAEEEITERKSKRWKLRRKNLTMRLEASTELTRKKQIQNFPKMQRRKRNCQKSRKKPEKSHNAKEIEP